MSVAQHSGWGCAMSHYRANRRDLEFNLFEVFDAPFGTAPFSDMDAGTAREVLAEVERLATDVLAESFVEADREPPTFDPTSHSAYLPDSVKKAYQQLMDGE